MTKRKNLPIGVSSFRDVRQSGFFYIDKTFLIQRLLDLQARTVLFTRPRRFGKSLALDMLHCFFDCTAKEENRPLFDGLAIAQSAEHIAEQGKYPVIRLSFNGAKYDDWEHASSGLASLLSRAMRQFRYLQYDFTIDEADRQDYAKLCSPDTPLEKYESALQLLSQMLCCHHGQPVIILIDEYDVPIQGAYQKGYFQEMIGFMRDFFTAGLKDNKFLRLAVLTGVMRIAKESLFSGINNLKVDTILSDKYADCFGFTQSEVEEMARYYDSQDKIAELKEWYDGYRFGKLDIYNPWSVLQYFDENCQAKAYWVDTSSNDLVIEFLSRLDKEQRDDIWELYRRGTVNSKVNTAVSYQQLDSTEADVIFSLMAVTGYLKPVRQLREDRYLLALPNREIQTIFTDEILRHIKSEWKIKDIELLGDAIALGDTQEFEKQLRRYLKESLSYFDNREAFYHGWMMGILVSLNSNYLCLSNREAGEGRSDITLTPRFGFKLPGLVMELKHGENAQQLDHLALQALQQIRDKHYVEAFPPEVEEVRCYGIAFCGKECVVKQETRDHR